MSIISRVLNPGKNYKDAQAMMDKYYQQSQGYMQPYIQQGQQAYGDYYGAQQNLLDPTKLQSEWAQSYEMSPYAQQLQEQAKQYGLDAASSMGLMGSSAGLENIERTSANIMQADRQQYLQDLMQKYLAGIGITQDIYGGGRSIGQAAGQNAMNMGQNMAQLEFARKNAGPSMLSNIIGQAVGGAMGSFGGAAGNALASKFGWQNI